MKRFFVLVFAVMILFAIASCGGEDNEVNGLPVYVDGKLFIVEDGSTNFQVTFPKGATESGTAAEDFSASLTALKNAFGGYNCQSISILDDAIPFGEEDSFVAPAFEILIGDTNRPESKIEDDLAANQAIIRVVGKKVVIKGKSDFITAMAVLKFIENYMLADGNPMLLPADLNESLTFELPEFDNCEATGKTYEEMASEIFSSYNEAFWDGTQVAGDFWHQAEMLETYIDVYECTKSEADKAKMLSFADAFISARGKNWQGNPYNDDIMWICIAFARISHLTGQSKYILFAESNFDLVYKRAWDDKLGGGLYWRTDNDTKNSCINCPAAIAACLIGDYRNDESYYDKAKAIMAWEIKYMFEPDTGRVYDAYSIEGEINEWASTYNNGTFIGACTLLYQHTKDETYLNYAGKAAEFAMTELATKGILNAEDSGNDLIGFKGILTRWMYRYAKEVESIEILTFLQNNAATAYKNKNVNGLVWTNWGKKTSNNISSYQNGRSESAVRFGTSTVVSLMYNCRPWW